MAKCYFCALLKMNKRRPKGGFQEGPLLHSQQQQQQSFQAQEISMTSGIAGTSMTKKIRLKAREIIVSGGKRGKIADFFC